MKRRRLLATVTTLGSLSIAGCSGGGDDGTGAGDPTTTPTSTAPATTTSTPTTTETEATTATTNAGGDPTRTATTTETTTPTETATPTETTTTAGTTTRRGTEGDTVTLRGVSFDPVRLLTTPGTTVEWVNRDNFTHNVIATTFSEAGTEWSYQKQLPNKGSTVSRTFDTPGVYQYLCGIHGESAMCGAILVGDVTLDSTMPCE